MPSYVVTVRLTHPNGYRQEVRRLVRDRRTLAVRSAIVQAGDELVTLLSPAGSDELGESHHSQKVVGSGAVWDASTTNTEDVGDG